MVLRISLVLRPGNGGIPEAIKMITFPAERPCVPQERGDDGTVVVAQGVYVPCGAAVSLAEGSGRG